MTLSMQATGTSGGEGGERVCAGAGLAGIQGCAMALGSEIVTPFPARQLFPTMKQDSPR